MHDHKNRKIKPANLRVSKPRKYKRQYCPVFNCNKVPKRLDNHLWEKHKEIPNKAERKKFLAKAILFVELSDEPKDYDDQVKKPTQIQKNN